MSPPLRPTDASPTPLPRDPVVGGGDAPGTTDATGSTSPTTGSAAATPASPGPTTPGTDPDGRDPARPALTPATPGTPASPSPDAPVASKAPKVALLEPPDATVQSLMRPLPTMLPTYDTAANGVALPTYTDASGNRLKLDGVATGLKGDANAIERISALIGDRTAMAYKAYGNFANARPSVEDAWDRGHAECDGIMATGAYLLVASGAVPKDDVVVAQSFALGGWHNVVVFRDPRDHQWKVMDYGHVVTVPGAGTREAALQQYFHENSGVSILYRIENPKDRPVALYHVKSNQVAMFDGATYEPGLGASMTGMQGTIRGVNDGQAGRPLPKATDPNGMRVDSTLTDVSGSLQVKGTRVDMAVSRQTDGVEVDKAGVAILTATGENSAAGGKVLFHRNPGSDQGSTLTAAGEWWKINGGNFIGIVAGANVRVDVLSGHSGTPVTTVAPFVAVQGGMTHTLVDGKTVSAEVFWNAYARLNVPFAVTSAGRAAIDDASNGVSPGNGLIEPGDLVSLAGLGANAGIRAKLHLSDGLDLNGQATGHTIVTDPTLAPLALWLPFRGSIDGKLALSYQGDALAAQIGVMGTLGSLYDRDVRVAGFATGRVLLGKDAAIDLSISGGQFVGGTNFGDATAGVSWRPAGGPVNLRLSGGPKIVADPGSEARIQGAAGVGISIDLP